MRWTPCDISSKGNISARLMRSDKFFSRAIIRFIAIHRDVLCYFLNVYTPFVCGVDQLVWKVLRESVHPASDIVSSNYGILSTKYFIGAVSHNFLWPKPCIAPERPSNVGVSAIWRFQRFFGPREHFLESNYVYKHLINVSDCLGISSIGSLSQAWAKNIFSTLSSPGSQIGKFRPLSERIHLLLPSLANILTWFLLKSISGSQSFIWFFWSNEEKFSERFFACGLKIWRSSFWHIPVDFCLPVIWLQELTDTLDRTFEKTWFVLLWTRCDFREWISFEMCDSQKIPEVCERLNICVYPKPTRIFHTYLGVCPGFLPNST